MDLRILIPVKPLDEGKSRLTPVLDDAARRALCERFLRRTVQLATARAPTIVITRDPAAAAMAGGAQVVAEPAGADLNASLDAGRRAARGAEALLVLPTDLPHLTHATLARLCRNRKHIAIVPDRHDSGTNLLFLPQAAVASFRFAYGIGSLAAHRAEAARLGIDVEVIRLADAAFDVDQPADYAELSAELRR
jgi:2-phospho-L-lactate/phosphoenolpyruvate guanylyltransferase